MSSESRGAPGELFVLSAPSGVGKTTLIKRLFESYPEVAEKLTFAVSHTTRPPRPGEVDGKDYHFVARSTFEAMVQADGFLEWAVVHDHLYGTSRQAVEGLQAEGLDVLLDIDVQGGATLRRTLPEAPSIFILPPSYEVLEARLRGRASDSEEQISRRLATSIQEVRDVIHYDYVIVNGELDRACQSLASIFLTRRCLTKRRARDLQDIIEGFPGMPT